MLKHFIAARRWEKAPADMGLLILQRSSMYKKNRVASQWRPHGPRETRPSRYNGGFVFPELGWGEIPSLLPLALFTPTLPHSGSSAAGRREKKRKIKYKFRERERGGEGERERERERFFFWFFEKPLFKESFEPQQTKLFSTHTT